MTHEALPVGAADDLSDVCAFWNTEPCGAHFVPKLGDERATFAEYRRFRYRTEWHIPDFAALEEARGKRVLEIGCGSGADPVMFAATHGACDVGVDLTQKAVDATRRHLALQGVEGRCELANVERLRYEDDSFDVVYSYGVLHHARSPERAMQEDGLERVRRQPAMVPHWVRGAEHAEIVEPGPHTIAMLGLGRSIGTPPGGITADVVTVSSFAALDSLPADAVRGRIVLYDVPFKTYGETVRYRGAGANRASICRGK